MCRKKWCTSAVEQLGGEVTDHISEQVTTHYLISSECSLRSDRAMRRVLAAQLLGIPVLSLTWLDHCYQQRKKVEEQSFRVFAGLFEEVLQSEAWQHCLARLSQSSLPQQKRAAAGEGGNAIPIPRFKEFVLPALKVSNVRRSERILERYDDNFSPSLATPTAAGRGRKGYLSDVSEEGLLAVPLKDPLPIVFDDDEEEDDDDDDDDEDTCYRLVRQVTAEEDGEEEEEEVVELSARRISSSSTVTTASSSVIGIQEKLEEDSKVEQVALSCLTVAEYQMVSELAFSLAQRLNSKQRLTRKETHFLSTVCALCKEDSEEGKALPSTTSFSHLIVSSSSDTETATSPSIRTLFAIVKGLPIVTLDFFRASVTAGYWVEAKFFRHPQFSSHVWGKSTAILRGKTISLLQSTSTSVIPAERDLVHLLSLAGATVLLREVNQADIDYFLVGNRDDFTAWVASCYHGKKPLTEEVQAVMTKCKPKSTLGGGVSLVTYHYFAHLIMEGEMREPLIIARDEEEVITARNMRILERAVVDELRRAVQPNRKRSHSGKSADRRDAVQEEEEQEEEEEEELVGEACREKRRLRARVIPAPIRVLPHRRRQ
eukprot:scaffold4140_cov178-Ochromonas_danica.AAC.13